MRIEVRPADWAGFAEVMGEKGGCGGCWCMLWRLSRKDWTAGAGQGNREAMKAVFETGPPPGLVGWLGKEPVGWLQVDERAAFSRLATSRVLKPVDDAPVWSVACFLTRKGFRRQGISLQMLRAACARVKARGGAILEGYPIDTPRERYPAVYAWTGFVQTFRNAGFEEVARRSETRPIMRRVLA